MEGVNINIIQRLVERETDCQKVSKCLKDINEWCHLDFKQLKAQGIISTAKKINFREQMAINSQNKSSIINNQEQCISWSFGEFKIFIWMIIYQCATHNIILSDIDQNITLEIQSIFPLKTPYFIRYELRLLVNSKVAQSTVWCKEENKILQKIMEELLDSDANEQDTDNINWRWVSFIFFTESKCRFFRNQNHCRQKWNNHLNPIVKKTNWTKDQDIKLFELVEKFGHKWSKISKFMDHTRTEHMVKNRYNRFLRLWNISKNVSFSVVRSLIKRNILDNDGEQQPKKMVTKVVAKRTKIVQEIVKVQLMIPKQEEIENEINNSNIEFDQQQSSQLVKKQEQQVQSLSLEQKKPDARKILMQQNDKFFYPFYNTFVHPFIPIPSFPYLT